MEKKTKKSRTGMQISVVPEGYNSVNPWIIPKGAERLISFLEEVFEGQEVTEARTYDHDNLLIHAEVKIGNSIIGIFDSKPGWPDTPSFLQVYVDDAEAVLRRAKNAGANIVTELTDFVYGERIARFRDRWGNLWWINERMEEVNWDVEMNRSDEADEGQENNYIRDTLLKAMREVKCDPVRT
jgi:PhnB protein